MRLKPALSPPALRGEFDNENPQKDRCGKHPPLKMLKMKIDPEKYMKTKDRRSKCPTKIRTPVPGRRFFDGHFLVVEGRFLTWSLVSTPTAFFMTRDGG